MEMKTQIGCCNPPLAVTRVLCCPTTTERKEEHHITIGHGGPIQRTPRRLPPRRRDPARSPRGRRRAPGHQNLLRALPTHYLKYGEVHNTIQDPIRLPEDLVREFASKPMAIVDYSVDIVDKEARRVPLYDGYNRKS